MKRLTTTKKFLNLPLLLTLVFSLAAGCIGVEKSLTPYKKAQQETSGPAPGVDELGELVGQDKAEALYAGLGQETLDLLSFNMGTSNMVALINGITDTNKLITLIGNNTADTGLGALRILALLNGIDDAKSANMSTNIQAAAPPANQDTIGAMIYLVETLTLAEIENKVIPLIDDPAGLAVDRFMGQDGGTPATEEAKINKLARLMAHVHRNVDADLDKVIDVLQGLCDADVISQLGTVIKDVNNIDVLIETMNNVSDGAYLTHVVNSQASPTCDGSGGTGVASIAKLVDIMNVGGLNGTKMGYVLDELGKVATTELDKVVSLIDNISTAARMGELINLSEDGSTWTGIQYGPSGALITYGAWGSGAAIDAPAATVGVDGVDSTVVRLVNVILNITDASKLATILDIVTDMNKMVRMIQDVQDETDVAYLVENLNAGSDMTKLGEILNNVDLANIVNMRELVDGQRVNGNAGTQNPTYLDKMVVLVQNLTDDAGTDGTIKTAQLVNGVNTPDKLIDLVYDVSVTVNLATVINNIDRSDEPTNTPHRTNAVNTLVYTVENLLVADIPKLVTIIDNISAPTQVSILVNDIAEKESQINGNQAGGAGETVAGEKMVTMISGTDFANNIVFVLDNVSSITKMADLVVTLSNDANGIDKVPVLINGIDNTGNNGAAPYGNTYNATAGSRGGATEMGKLVNMVDFTTSLADVATVLQGVTDVNKMITLVTDVTNSSDLVGTLNAAIAQAVLTELITVVNGIDATNDVPKLVVIVNNIGSATEGAGTTTPHADHTLVAQLMEAQSGATAGIGTAAMITLIGNTGSCDAAYYDSANCTGNGGTWNAADTAPALRLADVMTSTNTNLCYQEDCSVTQSITKREGLVRMVAAGVVYEPGTLNETFPGLGAAHLALMMNQTGAASDLITMLNNTDIMDVVVIVGCGDHVTGFQTPCTNVGQGW